MLSMPYVRTVRFFYSYKKDM